MRGHKKTINGHEYSWSGHCRRVKHKKQILNKDEIIEISKKFKKQSLKLPKDYNFKAKNGSKYDRLIAGWVHYWQEVLGKDANITTDFVKILMMSESSFNPQAKAITHDHPGRAIGLMQITSYTHKLIQPESKELKDHAFKVSLNDLKDPNINISVGVRWLFRKRQISKHFLKVEPTMLQLAEEYKGIRGDKSAKAEQQRKAFLKYKKKYEVN
ncbi:MAG: lytic transglycosylase domain-containing protein [Bdellovibrionales bacterium]|nr:lytic transglycosylase domain-containing protein [Bdellovibrionales bacterium]